MVVNSIHQVCHMKMAVHYAVMVRCKLKRNYGFTGSRVRLKPDGTRWRTGGEVKGKLANGVGSQYSHTTSEHGVSSITNTDAHNSAASSRLNWHPRRFKWTRPFRRKTKSGFCACAITFQTHSTITCRKYKWTLSDRAVGVYSCEFFRFSVKIFTRYAHAWGGQEKKF